RCLNGARVLALGVAYKREVGDTRESPAIEILMKLREKGCEVSYVDPYVPTLNLHGTTLKSVDLTDEELADADCVVILTDHSAFAQTAEIMVRLASVLTDARPNLVMVVGDVTSTIAAGLVANKMSLPLAHVEAGLRSFDRSMPEEINRIVTDTLADYCFTTEP